MTGNLQIKIVEEPTCVAGIDNVVYIQCWPEFRVYATYCSFVVSTTAIAAAVAELSEVGIE